MTDRELEILKLISLIRSNSCCHPSFVPLIETCKDCPITDEDGHCNAIDETNQSTLDSAKRMLKEYSEEEIFEEML